MSRFRPAMSAPRRPMKATSAPSAPSQAATWAPEPPRCVVTFAGVSLPRARGSVAWATVSVIKSPMTTMRAIIVITSSSNGCPAVRCLKLSRRRPASLRAVGDKNLYGDSYGIRNLMPLATASAGSYPVVSRGDDRGPLAGQERQAPLPVLVVHVHVHKRDRLPGAERQPAADDRERRVRCDD